ncbi:MAG: CvpA family protein [candidate division Zixibacteria bacterium]|nr:CvpA family protein [candidate division Zixibacteria bacterium]
MNWLNLLFAAILLFFLFHGLRRGFVHEILETIGMILAAVLAYRLMPAATKLIGITEGPPGAKQAIVCLVLFILLMIVVGFIARAARKAVESAGLGTMDRILGGAVSLFKGGIIIAGICWAFLWVGGKGEEAVKNSVIARVDLNAYQWLSNLLPDDWEKQVRDFVRDKI